MFRKSFGYAAHWEPRYFLKRITFPSSCFAEHIGVVCGL